MMKWPNCEMFVSFRLINSRAHFFQLVFACGESQILAVRDYLAMVAVVVVMILILSKMRSYNHQLITNITCRGPVHLVRDWLVHSTLPPTSRRPVRNFLILFVVSLHKQAFWWHCDMCFCVSLETHLPMSIGSLIYHMINPFQDQINFVCLGSKTWVKPITLE